MNRLEDILREGACLVGTGNPLRRDDGVGVWLAESLRGASAAVFNVEDVPESYVGEIARTGLRNVIIMDAVDAGLEPGTVVFGPLDELGERPGLSTHKLSLSLCGRFWAPTASGLSSWASPPETSISAPGSRRKSSGRPARSAT